MHSEMYGWVKSNVSGISATSLRLWRVFAASSPYSFHGHHPPGFGFLFRCAAMMMKLHDLTKKIPAYLNTYSPTYVPASFTEHSQGAIPETCDLWDTDYNSENWEPEIMTIFVTWRLIATLDSIRNSCDVLSIFIRNHLEPVHYGLRVVIEGIWNV